MKSIYRFFKVSSYETMNEVLAKIIQELEQERNKLRKNCLEEMENNVLSNQAEKVQKTMVNMNRDLTVSYEKEKILLEFINLLKS